jgi:dolichol-phosphate mannosyltransferase
MRLQPPRFNMAVRRPVQFALVGASGLVLNQLFVAALTEIGGLHYVMSAAAATQFSTTWNFVLSNSWVFGDRCPSRTTLLRLGQSLLVNNAMLLGRGPILVVLTDGLGIHYLLSNVISLILFIALRYVLADQWIWRQAESACEGTVFQYDIHGIIRIVSDTCLPELAYFQTSHPIERADLQVLVGSPIPRGTDGAESAAYSSHRFQYQDTLWRLGFGVGIVEGDRDCVELRASPILRYSTHVLYTNVVEPLLRWMLVRRGYALMHGACIKLDDRAALLITARTDTGKTSTVLHLLAQHSLGFLGDDMVILCPDGRALCYPKPLTISRHTLEAVDGTADLSRSERLALQLQSRVHSKSGRGIAFLLTRLPLPVATINAVVQLLIPPPKYAIGRLVPGAVVEHDATISRRVEIVRGPDSEVSIAAASAQMMALEDCEDAYGFPPYRALEPFLTTMGGRDLREAERHILRQALGGCPTTVISRRQRNWWPRIVELYVRDREPGIGGARSWVDGGDKAAQLVESSLPGPVPHIRLQSDREVTPA